MLGELREHVVRLIVMSGLVLTLACGCATRYSRRDIESPDASQRAAAIRVAADHNDREAIPLLVDRLEDDDEAVRFFAINALDRMTGRRFGYVFYRSPAEQEAAINRWRAWLADPRQNGGGTAQADAAAGDHSTAGLQEQRADQDEAQ